LGLLKRLFSSCVLCTQCCQLLTQHNMCWTPQ
jgi:hypothetical protein